MNTTVIGVGVDLVDVEELHQLLIASGDAFLQTAWTPIELEQCSGEPARLAASWAAKEAAMKALGVGLGEINPLEMEVDMKDQQRPVISLSGLAATVSDRLGVGRLSVSVAHDRRWAIATAFALGNAKR